MHMENLGLNLYSEIYSHISYMYKTLLKFNQTLYKIGNNRLRSLLKLLILFRVVLQFRCFLSIRVFLSNQVFSFEYRIFLSIFLLSKRHIVAILKYWFGTQSPKEPICSIDNLEKLMKKIGI